MLQEIFNVDYYRRQIERYMIGQDPGSHGAWRHFRDQGDALGLDPSPYFSTLFYKCRYPNWNRLASTAFEDFVLRLGKGQDRQPHPLIDPEHYRRSSPDLASLGAQAALHFMRHGDGEGRTPSAGFDAGYYRRCYLPLGQSFSFRHYVTCGAWKGFLPRPEPRSQEHSTAAMSAATAGMSHPFLLVSHDAQLAGVPILTIDLARSLRARGWHPVFLLGNGGPLLDDFKELGPVFILSEGWDVSGLASGLPFLSPALINTSAAAAYAVPLAQSGMNCLLLIHEMPKYIRDHGLMKHLRGARASGVKLIASMPRMTAELAQDPGGIAQVLPGICLAQTPFSAFRRRRKWRDSATSRQKLPVFIGAGHGDMRKGFDLFIAAAQSISAALPGARFVWLGALDSWAQSLADRALEEGLDLTLPGFVTDSLAWYRAADVYLLTSRQDPGPTTAIHAAAVGTPFIGYAADIGLVGLTDGIGHFVLPDDEAGFTAAAMATAAAISPTSRRILRKIVRQKSGFEKYVSALLAKLNVHQASD